MHEELYYAHNLAVRLELLLCNPAVRCSVPEKGHVQGKQGSYESFSLTERKNLHIYKAI